MFCNKCGNQINQNDNSCSKCGNLINIQQNVFNQNITNSTLNSFNSNYQNTNQVNYVNFPFKNDNKKMLFAGMAIGLVIVTLLFLIIYVCGNDKRYYFNINSNEENTEVIKSSGTSKKSGKYTTAIIYDNTYSGVKIKNSSDAFKLIENDSVSQKDNCPNEIKKVEDELINNYGITAVNLCEMDVGFAKELSNVFKKVYTEYPEVRGYITNLTLVNGSMRESYIAAFMPVFNFATSDTSSTYPWVIKTQVLLNTSYFLNKERLNTAVSEASDSGHFPKNSTIYSPLAHELGHYLSFLAMMKSYKLDSILLINDNNVTAFNDLYKNFAVGKYSLSMINEAYEKYKKDTNSNISLDEWRGTISNYALAKNNSGEYIYDETIAESFHDIYLNGDNANVASKYIISVLKQRLES